MSTYLTPQETAEAAVESGTVKAAATPANALVAGFLAGAYIAFGSLLAIVASAGLAPERWGGITTLVTGITFSLGLILVVVAGADLLTGNMMLLPMALLRRRISASSLVTNWGLVLVGNLLGALVVAYFFADQTGVIGGASSVAGTPAASTFARLSSITIGKAITESDYQVFLRAIGCNWMVCLGVWMAISAKDITGKILGIVFPVTAFVALGFDHVVANFFFLPLAMMQQVPGVTFAHVLSNLVFALLGNIVGAGLFVAGAYWFLYLKNRPAAAVTAAATAPQAQRARR